jgi:hypothetical protein
MPDIAITRRNLLQATAAPVLLHASQPGNPTVEENQRPGTAEWQLRHYSFDSGRGSGLRSPRLEGYCSETSVYPGETIRFLVSTDPPRPFVMDFYRTGYYGGKGARHMTRIGPIKGEPQPPPLMGVERVRECEWHSLAELTIPEDWPSGVYLGKMGLEKEPVESYVIFIVKSRRPADLLFQCSDFTWQSYNKWPGFDSMYDTGLPRHGNGFDYTGPHVRVSFDRPYAQYGQVHEVALSLGSGEYLLWEHPLSFWLEQKGYHVSYCSNLDTERDPGVLDRAKVFLSVGHDEYWTRPMYENVKAARDRGLSLAFLSGNAVMRQLVTYKSTVTGAPLRIFARLKEFEDEHLLMGVHSYGPGYGDWVATNTKHWIFEGTGMKDGDYIPGLVGWEYHGDAADLPGLEVVAATQLDPYSSRNANGGKFTAVVYPGPKANWVFNASTIWWSEGLSSPPGHAPAASRLARTFGPDERVQKITENFLNRCLKGVTTQS